MILEERGQGNTAWRTEPCLCFRNSFTLLRSFVICFSARIWVFRPLASNRWYFAYDGSLTRQLLCIFVKKHDPIEEGVKGISNIVEIASTSQDDYAIVAIEFDEEIEVDLAKQKVKDEVDAVVASR